MSFFRADGGSHVIRLSRSALTADQIDEGACRPAALMAVGRS